MVDHVNLLLVIITFYCAGLVAKLVASELYQSVICLYLVSLLMQASFFVGHLSHFFKNFSSHSCSRHSCKFTATASCLWVSDWFM